MIFKMASKEHWAGVVTDVDEGVGGDHWAYVAFSTFSKALAEYSKPAIFLRPAIGLQFAVHHYQNNSVSAVSCPWFMLHALCETSTSSCRCSMTQSRSWPCRS